MTKNTYRKNEAVRRRQFESTYRPERRGKALQATVVVVLVAAVMGSLLPMLAL